LRARSWSAISSQPALLRLHHGHFAQRLLDGGNHFEDLRSLNVLSQNPDSGAVDLRGLDLREGLDQMLDDEGAQGGELLDGLADEDQHVGGGQFVGVRKEFHQHGYNIGGHVGELNRACVQGAYEQLPVLSSVLVLHVVRLGHLLL